MSKDVERPLFEHLTELLIRLRISLFAILASSFIVSAIPANLIIPLFNPDYNYTSGTSSFYDPLVFYVMRRIERDMLDFSREPMLSLARILDIENVKPRLIAHGWFDTFITSFYIGLLMGLIVASPIMGYEIYKFLEPALYPHEKRFLKSFVFSFVTLFSIGIVYAYLYLLPITFLMMLWLSVSSGAEPIFSIRSFFYTVFLGLAVTGLFFTYPILMVLLVKFDIITPETLRKQWRYVLVGTLVVTAAITPDPTPVSMLMLSLPFMLLYFTALLFSELVYRKKRKSSS